MKVVTIVGARPQFVKASVVSRALEEHGGFDELIIHTGQHYDPNMSDIFFEELGIPLPARNLGIGSGSHGHQTGKMLEAIEAVLLEVQPDLLLVYGDTNSTLAGALAATKLHVPVAHVEAGLRSFNRKMPEEVNRVLTDHLSAYLFAPTDTAVANLQREGLHGCAVHQVGDVMYDVALAYGRRSDQQSMILEAWGLTPGAYALATVHRAENTNDPARLARIFQALGKVGDQQPVILPLHPRTRVLLGKDLQHLLQNGRIRLIDPVGYLDMLQLEKNANLILTDSGGVQKESYFFGVPCITLRDETEWVELVTSGWNRLWSPLEPLAAFEGLVATYRAGLPAYRPQVYGEGRSAHAIASLLSKKPD